jgi:hypothetical protein
VGNLGGFYLNYFGRVFKTTRYPPARCGSAAPDVTGDHVGAGVLRVQVKEVRAKNGKLEQKDLCSPEVLVKETPNRLTESPKLIDTTQFRFYFLVERTQRTLWCPILFGSFYLVP